MYAWRAESGLARARISQAPDLLGRREHRFRDHVDGDGRSCVESERDRTGVLGHPSEDVVPVQVHASGGEPQLASLLILHVFCLTRGRCQPVGRGCQPVARQALGNAPDTTLSFASCRRSAGGRTQEERFAALRDVLVELLDPAAVCFGHVTFTSMRGC